MVEEIRKFSIAVGMIEAGPLCALYKGRVECIRVSKVVGSLICGLKYWAGIYCTTLEISTRVTRRDFSYIHASLIAAKHGPW